MTFVAATQPVPGKPSAEHYWFCFQGDRLLVFLREGKAELPLITDLSSVSIEPIRTQFLGELNGTACSSAEVPLSAAWPDGSSFLNLVELFHVVDEELYKAAVYAKQIVAWDREHQYCGCCGKTTVLMPTERARQCQPCGLLFFPRLSPAIMVAVLKEDKILLARNHRFPGEFYSVLAGFVDPGERLEECIVREVREEVGLEIKNLRYFNSQPWPFPNSLMIAFIADYASGEIRVDGSEITEADWFPADKLPKCPRGNLSVAGRLIDWFREGGKHA